MSKTFILMLIAVTLASLTGEGVRAAAIDNSAAAKALRNDLHALLKRSADVPDNREDLLRQFYLNALAIRKMKAYQKFRADCQLDPSLCTGLKW